MNSSQSSDKRLKVLQLINDLESGGAQRMLTKLVKHTDPSRFENVVITLRQGGAFESTVLSAGVRLFSLNCGSARSTPYAITQLAKLLRRERPTIIQTWLYHADFLGLLGAEIARFRNIVWNVRCSDMDLTRYSLRARSVLRVLSTLSNRPRAVLFNSEAGMRHHLRIGYRPKLALVIPNGFEEPSFTNEARVRISVRRELGLPDDALVIGMVARYDPMKDQATFLEAAAQALQTLPFLNFVMLGRGVTADNQNLTSHATRLGISKSIRLLGERDDAVRVISALDILALPSAFGEGFPNVVGEAMACGVPCVVSAVGDSAAVVGDCGLIVPPRDPTALKRAWEKLLSLDDLTLCRLKDCARQRIKNRFAMSRITDHYQSLYTSIAEQII